MSGPDLPSLASFLAHYPGPAVLLGASGLCLAVNPALTLLAEETGNESGSLGRHLWQLWREHGAATSISVSSRFFWPLPAGDAGPVLEWTGTPLPEGPLILLGRDIRPEQHLQQALAESRQRYKDLVTLSSDFAWETDATGRFVFISPAGVLGFAAQDWIGREAADLLADPLTVAPFLTRKPLTRVEVWLKASSGGSACVRIAAGPLTDASGRWSGARGVGRNVTQERQHTVALAQARTRERVVGHIIRTLRDTLDANDALHTVVENIARAIGADGSALYGWEPEERPHVLAASGIAATRAVETGLAAMLPPAATPDAPCQYGDASGSLLGQATRYRQAVNGALCVWRLPGQPAWSDDEQTLLADVADSLGIALAQRTYQERLRRLSEQDELTGLLNRRTFMANLEERLQAPVRSSALLYVDLDHFKAVNDSHGHHRGDEVLICLARLLTLSLRPRDLAGRLGGDEFVLWLDGVDEAAALTFADRLLVEGQILRPFSASPDKPLAISVGLAVHLPESGETLKGLLERADSAMYAVKRGGRGHRVLAPPPVRT